MKRPDYKEFDDDTDWLFIAFMTVVAEAIQNDVDMGLVAQTANSVAATAAKENLSKTVEKMKEER